MLFRKLCSLFLCMSFLFFCFAGCANIGVKKPLSQEEASALLYDAYIYTLPLMLMDATFTKMTNTVEATNVQAPVNQFIHAKSLATADFKDVVTPNVDTIYSQVFYDLSNDSLILEFPKTDRFCTVEIIDAYTNCIAIIDAATFANDIARFIFTPKGQITEIPDGMNVVESPTDIGWVIVRTICNSRDDEKNVHAIQEQMKAYTLSCYKAGTVGEKQSGSFDPDNNFVPVQHVFSMGMKEYFQRANMLMVNNPPAEADEAMMKRLERIGVGPALKFDGAELGSKADSMWKETVSRVTQRVTEESMKFMTQNGIWSYMGEPIAEFGTEYAYRALISIVGLGANPVSVAVYPKVTTDNEGGRLNGQNSYTLHFEKDQLPPVEELGFWSVTAYNSSDNFLIDNEIDRYCINDRSDVVYNDDGSLDIIIQKNKPSDNESNWLPVSSGDFHLVLRVYLPEESVLIGQWQAPTITKQN